MSESELGLAPLTPLSHLDRAAEFFPERKAYRFDGKQVDYKTFREQVLRAVAALDARGVRAGDRVLLLARNTPLALLSHFAVPAAGATLVALNHRLAVPELAGIMRHAGPTVVLADPELAGAAAEAAAQAGCSATPIVEPRDLAEAGPLEQIAVATRVSDERDLISINYTSGTTGAPKGAMYRHRGAFLQAVSMAYHVGLDANSRYLWTLPMFHCNGWSFPWAVVAAGGTSICTESTDPEVLWQLIVDERVTHFCAAPTLLTMLIASPHAVRPDQEVTVATGGAPPTPALIRRAETLGLSIVHLYGLTETYGPSLICSWQSEWDGLAAGERAAKLSRQGISTIAAPSVALRSAENSALPELTVAGNTVMAGYYRDDKTTAGATDGKSFLTGDLAEQHADRYIEIRDRSKDVIISGGENISSVEVEHALAEHPSVNESAVVSRPDDKWGEVPVAFVSLTDSATGVDGTALISFLRGHLAGYKVPREYHFGELPKTATGKIRKVELRERLRAAPSASSPAGLVGPVSQRPSENSRSEAT